METNVSHECRNGQHDDCDEMPFCRCSHHGESGWE